MSSCGKICLHELTTFAAELRSRGVLSLKGSDTEKLLQSLMTQDVRKLQKPGSAAHTGFLNSRGRLVFDSILSRVSEHEILVDVDAKSLPGLVQHLKRYKLRADVTVTNLSGEFSVWSIAGVRDSEVLWDMYSKPEGVTAFEDPRTSRLGLRAVLPRTSVPNYAANGVTRVTEKVYHFLRTLCGVCEGSAKSGGDFEAEELPLECNLDLTDGVSFDKGCYVGQELTARTHHTGVVRKRFVPMAVATDPNKAASAAVVASTFQYSPGGQLFPGKLIDYDSAFQVHGAPLKLGDLGRASGQLRSCTYNLSLGHVRLDHAFSGTEGPSCFQLEGPLFAVPYRASIMPSEVLETG